MVPQQALVISCTPATPATSATLAGEAAIPFIAPEPPRLSRHLAELEAIEASGVYSNYGPMNSALEAEFLEAIFGREGHCVTVCNATLGLLLAIREVIGFAPPGRRRYALMPSFTFAAAAQAALWCGLTPLFCDIDPETWLPAAEAEAEMLDRYRDQIAVIVPYATFGNNLNLSRYSRLADAYGVPVVVDAAASLGSLDDAGRAFGHGFAWPVVFSMHATKAFAVGEGGLIYCADEGRIARLRAMASFGFLGDRRAEMIGLNAKMSEVTALTARLQLRDFGWLAAHRETLGRLYLQEIGKHLGQVVGLQRQVGVRQMRSFQPVLLPEQLSTQRAKVLTGLQARGIGAGTYFSPHVAEQPLFTSLGECGPLPVTDRVAARILSLPLHGKMTPERVCEVLTGLHSVLEEIERKPDGRAERKRTDPPSQDRAA